MEMEINLPKEIAVMTLPNIAFFPQALLPLHIFEPRYRQMLAESLASDRLFAVVGAVPQSKNSVTFEPHYRVATVGIVRACQENSDGTSNLLLQGLARVRVQRITREDPFRMIKITALSSQPGASTQDNDRLKKEVSSLILTKQRLGATIPAEFSQFLKSVEDPETFVDLAAFSLCDDVALKQKLLETLDVHRRLQLFSERLRSDIQTMKLEKKLQGKLDDENISSN